MKFFAVHIEDLESERFLSASNDQIATWLLLHALCSKQTNQGTIAEAASIPERFWSRHGIDHAVLIQPSPLWSWDGDSLTVEPYDIAGEVLYLKKSKGGREGNSIRWGDGKNKSLNRTPNRTPNPPNNTQQYPTISENRDSLFEDTPTLKKSKARGTLEELKAYAKEIGLPESDGESMFLRWEENGWMNGKSKVRCWRTSMRRWEHEGWFASQKAPSRPESHAALLAHSAELGVAETIATAWWDKRRAVGWKLSGQPIADWKADLIGFVEAWHRNEVKK